MSTPLSPLQRDQDHDISNATCPISVSKDDKVILTSPQEKDVRSQYFDQSTDAQLGSLSL